MDVSSSDDHGLNNSVAVKITGKVMVVAIIVLFVVVVFILFLHLYAKWFWWRIEQPPSPPPNRRRRRSRFVFAPGQDPSFTLRTGLDPAVLRSIPVVVFSPEDFKEGLECAVCLSELVQGEKARLLPKCNHGFHVECIDMWFQSHLTCPICRNPVDDHHQQGSDSLSVELQSAELFDTHDSHDNLVSGYSTESPNFPTNVLFWGNETQVSTGGASLEEGPSSSSSSSSSTTITTTSTSTSTLTLNSGRPEEMVVLDIEEGIVEEEEKSPAPPTRLRSFKRLLSREKKVNPTTSTSNCSGTSCDDEHVRR